MGNFRVALALCLTGCAMGADDVNPTHGRERGDSGISVLAGEWKIDYTHGAVRTYVVEAEAKSPARRVRRS